MNVVVIGPTEHTRKCLEELLKDKDLSVRLVIALDDAHARKKARWTTFDDLAETHQFKLMKSRVKDPVVIKAIESAKPEIIFEFGASEMIPSSVLKLPPKGVIGSHGGELPFVKGGSSLNWALIRGEKQWGVSLYFLAEKVDEGDVIGTQRFDVELRDDIRTLHEKSDLAIVELLHKHLPAIKKGTVSRIKNWSDKAIYLPNRKPEDALINWKQSTPELYNWIRAQTHPFPGSFTDLNGKRIYVWKADNKEYKLEAAHREPGRVVEVVKNAGIYVKTGSGCILLQRVQGAGQIEMWADEFAEKNEIEVGQRLGEE